MASRVQHTLLTCNMCIPGCFMIKKSCDSLAHLVVFGPSVMPVVSADSLVKINIVSIRLQDG